MTDFYRLTIHDAHDLLKKKEISASELTRALLERISQVEPDVHTYIRVTPEQALSDALEADKRISRGDMTPLIGIPLAIKDILCTAGIVTTAGSRILENHVPVYDATVMTKLKQAGAVILGKANMAGHLGVIFFFGAMQQMESVKQTSATNKGNPLSFGIGTQKG